MSMMAQEKELSLIIEVECKLKRLCQLLYYEGHS
jgi:hypothetical protein